MDQTVIGLGWQVRLPDGWEHNGSVSPAILTPPDNSSVVVITTSRIYGGLTEEDLRHLVRDIVNDGHEPEKVAIGDFHGLTFRYVEDEIYYRHWLVSCERRLLEIFYDCQVSLKGKHDEAIDTILASLAADADTI